MSQASYASMTAFAQIDCQIEHQSLQVRVKSVNHKQLKYHIFVGSDNELESWIGKELHHHFERGHIEVHLELRAQHQEEEELKQWIERAKSQGLPSPTWSDLYAKYNHGSTTSTTIKEPEALKPIILECLQLLKNRRLEEGSAMIQCMQRDTTILVQLLQKISLELPNHHQSRVDKFKQKLNQYLESIDGETREDLARECAHLLEKIDVQEECDRLQTHLERFKHVLDKEHRGGRYLDFLCQEIHREITTLGNKSQSAQISEWVVDFKTHLEKLREQCQNLE